MTIKGSLKRIYEFFLLKKDTVLIEKDETKPNYSCGKILEFIGPSGVGKTTLFNLTKDKLCSKWHNLAVIHPHKINNADEKLINIHWDILKKKFNYIEFLKSESFIKLKLNDYFNQVLLNNIKLMSIKSESGFFLEEGICHNFSEELITLNDEDLIYILKNRCLIYILSRESMNVVGQIKKRINEGGHTVHHHKGLNDIQLNTLTKDSIHIFNKFLERIKKFSIPVCKLYLEDGLEENFKKIIDFERSLFKDELI
ncbi:hypothetical protein [Mariniflexile sp.]|uniref:hypothetical protein n=2 Tax=Mariniflexile sp. TaxID=1979402 RepID=UPI0040471FDD